MGMNIHYIHDWKKKWFNIACCPFDSSHTGENIFKLVSDTLEEWNILDKVSIALRDNAANMICAFEQ